MIKINAEKKGNRKYCKAQVFFETITD